MTRVERRAPSALRLWGPVALQMAIIFAASSIPHLGGLPGHVSDKAAHALGYGLLGALLLRALAAGRWDAVTLTRAAAAIAVSLVYALSDEFHQHFVPGRSADLFDVGADVVGATIAVGLAGVAAGARACGILKFFDREQP